MVLIPWANVNVDDDIASGMDIIRDKKALILVPTYRRSEKWSSVASRPSRENVPQAMSAFRDVTAPDKMILTGRYDGIDLPGHTCRVLVIDDLPTGLGPLERFQWERLSMQSTFRSTLAPRIVQSFGRISRGMSDHGVVILTGQRLMDWIRLPRNRSLLPKFLQRQLEIGEKISNYAANPTALIEAANTCLSRDQAWIRFYNDNMREDVPKPAPDEAKKEKIKAVALTEASFGEALWSRDFQRSVLILQNALDDAFDISQSTDAWLTLWLGFALEMSGDGATARAHYVTAYANQSNIPRPVPELGNAIAALPEQVLNVQQQMWVWHPRPSAIQIPRTLSRDLTALSGSGTVPQTEKALRCLGQYLGLRSTRPDKEFGTGPDVLWVGENGYAVCMEVKSEKGNTSGYRKEDVAQLHDHTQWVKDNYSASEIIPVFVGPSLPASKFANPSRDIMVIELKQFEEFGKKLGSALADVAVQAIPLSLAKYLHHLMKSRGLLYPDVFLSLDYERSTGYSANATYLNHATDSRR